MRFAIYTLGCKVNQYESQALEGEGLRRGHTLVPFRDEAEVYIVNTCTVTAVSDAKNRQVIRRVRSAHPQAVVAVCGCFPQTHPGQGEELGADLVCGTGERGLFWDRLEEAVRRRGQVLTFVDDVMARRTFEALPAGGLEGRTRAMLKVEDGCVNFCTYCIIPYARGPVRSLPVPEAVAAARALADQGYRELVVTGIEISSWGRDLPGKPPLSRLLEALSLAVPQLRIRLGSLEPRTVTEAFCAQISSLHNICPHFHLSLQSGSDDTLRRMNRKYDTARFCESVALLRKYYVNPAITTDVIVGFPGETEETFRESLDFLRKCRFSALHIFPYSRRPGTPAAKLPDQVPNGEKKRRAAAAAQVAAELKGAYLQSQVGLTLPVLFEEEKEGLWQGHSPNYLLVRAAGSDLHNVLREVRITGISGDHLLGELT